MDELEFADMTHSEYTAAEDGHDLFGGEEPCREGSLLDLCLQGMWLVVEILYHFELFGAEVGKGQYFVVKGIEIEVVVECQIMFLFLDIFVKKFLARKGMLDHNDFFRRIFIFHQRTSLSKFTYQYMILIFCFGFDTIVTH